jgi:phenylacetate-coenzyme A ligase PaaK-like adenylate-forming protein
VQLPVSKISEKIFTIDNFGFEEVALEIFAFQYTYNPVYRQFADHLKINAGNIRSVYEIPFLPIEFFKTHEVIVQHLQTEKVFESSGTGGLVSRHYVADAGLYQRSFREAFHNFYDDIGEWVVLALLPSYLERNTSSLVFMMDDLIKRTGSKDSGFYLDNFGKLARILEHLRHQNKKVLLVGVTFALLDFAERHPMNLEHITIMETGGMKGRREEITREKVHGILKESFGVGSVHSEYGMTELLSQAYSKGEGIFETPPWMKVFKRDLYDPMHVNLKGRGGLNVIDLANLYSCSFIATEDLVQMGENNHFEVLGRIDNSDIRGCNLMVSG